VLVTELADQPQVLYAREVLVDSGVLAGQPDLGPDRLGVVNNVQIQHGRVASVGFEDGGQDADSRGLARPVGPEQA
jgi:hypothetical protein